MKKVFMLVALLASFLFLSASAFAFSIRTPYAGPIEFKFANWENQVTQVGDELAGIFKISSIYALDVSHTLLWADQDGGEELTGTFDSYIVDSIVPGATGGTDIFFSGGEFNVYLDNTPDFIITNPGSGVTDGILFLSAVGITGIIPGDLTTTLFSNVTQLTIPFTGHGAGYLALVGGDYVNLFGGVGAQLLLENDFKAEVGGYYGWAASSQDPVTGAMVPEPATMILLGCGLIGLAARGRRKFFKK